MRRERKGRVNNRTEKEVEEDKHGDETDKQEINERLYCARRV